MSKLPTPHKITERCIIYSPKHRQPYQCRHCRQLFHTKNSALKHQCKEEEAVVGANR